MNSRKTTVNIKYNGQNISTSLNSTIKNIVYTDVATGESDSISLSIADVDEKWIGDWQVTKEDYVDISAIIHNYNNVNREIKFGELKVDSYDIDAWPLTINIKAVSVPATEGFLEDVHYSTWESTSIKKIAMDIANKYNLTLVYESVDIPIASAAQNESDSTFLYGLCKKYGLGMKGYKNKIIIYSLELYEQKAATITLTKTDMISMSYNRNLAGEYTGAKISYTNAADDETYDVIVGSTEKLLELNDTVDNYADAVLIATARVNEENNKMATMNITIAANPDIYASNNVMISGLKKLDGKYAIEKVVHNISANYIMNVSLRLINERIKSNVMQQQDDSNNSNYTIVKGDTLWAIAKRHYGNGAQYLKIYNANVDIIESVAHEHGKSSSDNGHWIYPGTEIVIPE